MKYDPNTSNVDRWHGMTPEDMSRGYKPVADIGSDDSNNMGRLNGKEWSTDDEPVKDSD